MSFFKLLFMFFFLNKKYKAIHPNIKWRIPGAGFSKPLFKYEFITLKATPILKIEKIIRKGLCNLLISKNFHTYKANNPREKAETPYILAKPSASGETLLNSGILSAAKNNTIPARISTIAVKRKNFLIIFFVIERDQIK